jgi:hypothetical protein
MRPALIAGTSWMLVAATATGGAEERGRAAGPMRCARINQPGRRSRSQPETARKITTPSQIPPATAIACSRSQSRGLTAPPRGAASPPRTPSR